VCISLVTLTYMSENIVEIDGPSVDLSILASQRGVSVQYL